MEVAMKLHHWRLKRNRKTRSSDMKPTWCRCGHCDGYKHALQLDVDAVVIGADGQMEPSEMTDILNPVIDEQADYVKGNRFGHPDVFKSMPLVRFLGTATLTQATRWATGYRTLKDSQCGYTAISAATLRVYPSTLCILAMVFRTTC